MLYRVLIPTAGQGRRLGKQTKYINKSLININHKPAICHIIESYPSKTEFVIALGYKGALVKNFLQLAYPNKKFLFVIIDKYIGKGSGLSYTILCCKKYLKKPFIFHACDTLINGKIPKPEFNWMGFSNTKKISNYRTITINKNKINKIYSKKRSLSNSKAYIGLSGIKDTKKFWINIEKNYQKSLEQGEVIGLKSLIENIIKPIYFEWDDIGNIDNLNKIQNKHQKTSKINILKKEENEIWFVNNKVIKFFKSDKSIKNIIKRNKLLHNYTPKINKSYPNLFSYNMVKGQVLASVLNNKIFLELLKFSNKFWKIKKITEIEKNIFIKHCLLFYKNKTSKRISLFYRKFNIKDKKEMINHHTMPKLSELLNQVDWKNISNGIPARFHGDFHFENILFQKEKSKFILLDWRENFSKYLNLGDVYYDLAKLLHGIIMPHEIVNKEDYKIQINKNTINFSYKRKKELINCEKILYKWIINNNYDLRKVKIITSLIFLNISPLHHYPYSLLLYYLGKELLFKLTK